MGVACQRWSPGRAQSWRWARDGGFDASRYGAAVITEATAKPWLLERHYSGTFPAARLQIGMFDLAAPGRPLVGAAVLSVPASERVLTSVFPTLAPYRESLELGRFCLEECVPGNGETWFLAEVFRLAAHAGIRGVVSFSDPLPRTSADGAITFIGHLGIIYQAKGAQYLGTGTPRTLILLPNGTTFNARTQQKIRAGERGHEAAVLKLVHAGARPPHAGEPPAAWLKQALADVGRTVRHPGCHKYAFRLGVTRRDRARVVIVPRSRPYPKWPGGIPPSARDAA